MEDGNVEGLVLGSMILETLGWGGKMEHGYPDQSVQPANKKVKPTLKTEMNMYWMSIAEYR